MVKGQVMSAEFEASGETVGLALLFRDITMQDRSEMQDKHLLRGVQLHLQIQEVGGTEPLLDARLSEDDARAANWNSPAPTYLLAWGVNDWESRLEPGRRYRIRCSVEASPGQPRTGDLCLYRLEPNKSDAKAP